MLNVMTLKLIYILTITMFNVIKFMFNAIKLKFYQFVFNVLQDRYLPMVRRENAKFRQNQNKVL